MATLLAHIRVHEGREPEFERMVGQLHAETHRREAGVRHYDYWRGAEPGLYYCLLAFDDFTAFLEHQTSDHHEASAPELGDLIRDMELEWVDPVQGASKLPPTGMQPLAEDADALTTRYHRVFEARVQAWWARLRDESDESD